MRTPPKPFKFDGTVAELYRDWIKPALPRPKDIARFDRWLSRYCRGKVPVFPVRQVRGTERRLRYRTGDGTRIAPADNSPAWAVHTLLIQERLSSYAQFTQLMSEMPVHFHDVTKAVGPTANRQGYYFAHILPVKNRDTHFHAWRRSEVERRCVLMLHPCNFFLVPGGRAMGEDKRIVQFVASQYARRYKGIWPRFLKRVGESGLQFDAVAPDTRINCSGGVVGGRSSSRDPAANEPTGSPPTKSRRATPGLARYSYGRLCFKRDVIEPLTRRQEFEVKTAFGIYRFTKAQFYKAFPRIPMTRSYRERGIYHGAKLHLRAESFRVRES